ncbi:hypothetical protein ACIQUF_02370 [Pseudomonas sp. NPDC090233]|uniref:hypothetical protein n=1 Tax=Pseudomonas sp. NPDC090233 TaxID=3364479 RepID=UPI00383A19D1
MRKFWRRGLVVLALLTVAGVAAVMIYLRQPVFGQLPEGERLAHVQASPNYRSDAFQNLTDTPFLTKGATQWSIRKENFLAVKDTLQISATATVRLIG